MADDTNIVVLVGRLTRDPELKETRGGALCRLALAVNRDKKVGDRWEPTSHYFDASLWGKQAEMAARTLHKGSRVAIQGHLEFRQYEAADGTARRVVSVGCERIQLLDPRDSPPKSQPTQERLADEYEQEARGSDVPNDLDESDIPFRWLPDPLEQQQHTHNPFV